MKAQKQLEVHQQRTNGTLVVELQVVGPIEVRAALAAGGAAAVELLLAIGFQFMKPMEQQAAQLRLLETGKVITLAAADGMQCFLDGEVHSDGGGVEDNFLQFVDAVGARHAVGIAELFQHAVGPFVQGAAALGLGAGIFLGAKRYWNQLCHVRLLMFLAIQSSVASNDFDAGRAIFRRAAMGFAPAFDFAWLDLTQIITAASN
jgi:hypothetical protein